jgi:hypothetical protein
MLARHRTTEGFKEKSLKHARLQNCNLWPVACSLWPVACSGLSPLHLSKSLPGRAAPDDIPHADVIYIYNTLPEKVKRNLPRPTDFFAAVGRACLPDIFAMILSFRVGLLLHNSKKWVPWFAEPSGATTLCNRVLSPFPSRPPTNHAIGRPDQTPCPATALPLFFQRTRTGGFAGGAALARYTPGYLLSALRAFVNCKRGHSPVLPWLPSLRAGREHHGDADYSTAILRPPGTVTSPDKPYRLESQVPIGTARI